MQGIRFNRRGIIKVIILCAVLVVAIALDLITKTYFKELYEKNGRTVIIDNFFYLTFVENSGSAFSFMADVSWGQLFFKILTCVALVLFAFVFVYTIKNRYTFFSFGIVFIISGTIGNFVDRLLFDKVRDFIGFTFGTYNFPIFNLADVFLTIGAIMFVIHFLFIDKNAVFKNKDEKDKLQS